jgi:hypothetical protein
VCFYNNTLDTKYYNDYDLQARLVEATTDYFVYVWYSIEDDAQSVAKQTNIVGTFQLNSSTNYLQDGFTLDLSNTIYLVAVRNLTVANQDMVSKPHLNLQYTIFDRSLYLGDSTDDMNTAAPVPGTVILIAIVIGGILGSLCIWAVGYVICQGLKKKPLTIPAS